MTEAATEILFVVRDAEDGGLIAEAVGVSIITEADDLDELRVQVRDAVACHFFDAADERRPRTIRLHLVRDEVIAA